MDLFLSCDWGTSSFRLRLVEKDKLAGEIKSEKGIASVFEEWKKKEGDRLGFYQSYLLQQIKKLEEELNVSLQNLPLVISGMASSSIGMIELPYKKLPFQTDGSDLEIKKINASGSFPHQLIIISGTATETDVLRGEETLLVGGCESDEKGVFIFPGTHSKHIKVEVEQAIDFKTYMTGEIFHLLSVKSILSNSVQKNEYIKEKHKRVFSEAVLKGAANNILNAAFHVRTNQLFGTKNKEENYHYLSGLLIGAELSDLKQQAPSSITLICSEGMKELYSTALEVLGLHRNLRHQNDMEALIKGQLKIWQCIDKKLC